MGDPDCIVLLQSYLDAPDEHLQIEQVSLYVKALWHKYWNIILVYYMLYSSYFCLLAITVVFFPNSTKMFQICALFASVLILNEVRQMFHEGVKSYMSEPFNYLDFVGNGLIIYCAIKMTTSTGNEFYEDRQNIRMFVIALLLVGFRAVSNLFIFD